MPLFEYLVQPAQPICLWQEVQMYLQHFSEFESGNLLHTLGWLSLDDFDILLALNHFYKLLPGDCLFKKSLKIYFFYSRRFTST